jgi:hypothetical protein
MRLILILIFLSLCQTAYAAKLIEIREQKSLSDIVIPTKIFYSKQDADQYAVGINGVVIKEQGQEMYYVFPKGSIHDVGVYYYYSDSATDE